MFACIWFFKFLSYHHIWHDIRYHKRKIKSIKESLDKATSKDTPEGDPKDKELSDITSSLGNKLEDVSKYPSNIKAYDVWMFCLIPTLCFQLKYPYNERGSVVNFVYRLIESTISTIIWVTIFAEFSIPLVELIVSDIKNQDYLNALYNFMKLSVPNTYGWLFQFYLGFHAYLNAWAELTGFADKNFYDDWWNSKTLGEYWRKWNLPVHHWMTRHLYFPMRRRKISRGVAMVLVFTFSAILHEYMLAGCFGVITLIGFNGMMAQLPVIMIQDKFKRFFGGQIGNIFFWIFFCVIGQPSGMVVVYYVLA